MKYLLPEPKHQLSYSILLQKTANDFLKQPSHLIITTKDRLFLIVIYSESSHRVIVVFVFRPICLYNWYYGWLLIGYYISWITGSMKVNSISSQIYYYIQWSDIFLSTWMERYCPGDNEDATNDKGADNIRHGLIPHSREKPYSPLPREAASTFANEMKFPMWREHN